MEDGPTNYINYIRCCTELERDLKSKNKNALLATLKAVVPPGINFIFIRQPEPLGLGHAVLCAQPVVGEEPFAVLLADDLIDAKQPAIAPQFVNQMLHINGQRVNTSLSSLPTPASAGAFRQLFHYANMAR